MAEQYLAIVNPAAGGGRCGREAEQALASLRESGLDVASIETKGPGEGTQIVRKAFREGVRHFIAVGGDGTGFEIVNGLFPEAATVSISRWAPYLVRIRERAETTSRLETD